MAYVQSGPGRVWKHVEYIVLRLAAIKVHGTVGAVFRPGFLPPGLNVAGIVFHGRDDSKTKGKGSLEALKKEAGFSGIFISGGAVGLCGLCFA
jgi:hypothetical protein